MSTELREELKAFERDLGHLVARFLRLYEKLEAEVRPESRRPPAQAPKLEAANASTPLLSGYQ